MNFISYTIMAAFGNPLVYRVQGIPALAGDASTIISGHKSSLLQAATSTSYTTMEPYGVAMADLVQATAALVG